MDSTASLVPLADVSQDLLRFFKERLPQLTAPRIEAEAEAESKQRTEAESSERRSRLPFFPPNASIKRKLQQWRACP